MTDIDSVLKLKVGGKKQAGIIEAIKTEKVPDKDRNILPKILLVVTTETNTFKIDEAWVYNKDSMLKPQGLWIKLDAKGSLNAISTLAKVLDYLDANTIQDLVGKHIELFPKPNGFLALIACENEMFEE
ncbi:MAG: hypothetical protein ACP5N7_03495 [Candidatus Pacearchaeota archaeon]